MALTGSGGKMGNRKLRVVGRGCFQAANIQFFDMDRLYGS